MSLLSGRRVFPKAGGHGVGSNGKSAPVHGPRLGRPVRLKPLRPRAQQLPPRGRCIHLEPARRTKLVLRSWNRKSGGKDPYGVDDGTAKIDRFKIMRDDSKSVGWWRDTIERKPAELSVIELSGVLNAGADGGFKGQDYQKAVRKAFQPKVAVVFRPQHRQVARDERHDAAHRHRHRRRAEVALGGRRAPGRRATRCRCG